MILVKTNSIAIQPSLVGGSSDLSLSLLNRLLDFLQTAILTQTLLSHDTRLPWNSLGLNDAAVYAGFDCSNTK